MKRLRTPLLIALPLVLSAACTDTHIPRPALEVDAGITTDLTFDTFDPGDVTRPDTAVPDTSTPDMTTVPDMPPPPDVMMPTDMPEACFDGRRNGLESDTDCGGAYCRGCNEGERCNIDTDCSTNFCLDRQCAIPSGSCDNGLVDGTETDLDCGGPECDRCVQGQLCEKNRDCVSRFCANGVCATTDGCFNGQRDSGESDIDCGGPVCPQCGNGLACNNDKDCLNGDCRDGRCAEDFSCFNGMHDPGESDVDCGGFFCSPCEDGALCSTDGDCVSRDCRGGICGGQGTNCFDGRQNNEETDIDCGGGICDGCRVDQRCNVDRDCNSFSCQNGICGGSCFDGLLNEQETDIDCGGPACGSCFDGQTCKVASDCFSFECHDNVCGPPGLPASCAQVLERAPNTRSGYHLISPNPMEPDRSIQVYCDMERDGGGWTVLANVTRTRNTPTPGREAAGGDVNRPQYSVEVNGLEFGEIAITHNGLPPGEDFASFELRSPTRVDVFAPDFAHRLANGNFAILWLSASSSGNWGPIALACINSPTPDCRFVPDRRTAFGLVATGSGNCQQLNDGNGQNRSCGSWGSGQFAGNTTWGADGGRIMVR